MKQKLIIKYISIIFIFATFIGSMHHHNDLQEHNDCKICTIQHNIINIDTPTAVCYLTLFTTQSEATVVNLKKFQIQSKHFTFSARAPPHFL
jgi:hypothetical protein